jgi:ribulose-phosphate 3-epimerase
MLMLTYKIAPSLLSADFARLGEEAQAVLDAGADMLHLDVMDNHYVPNLTVGPMVCAALRHFGIKAPIDVHLMTTPVDQLITDFAEAGASNITFHPDATIHVDRSLALIRAHGCKAGLAINPATTLDCLEYVFDKLDLILIMSVNPGFGGQSFIPISLEKIRRARQLITASGHNIDLAVDGGVKIDNIAEIAHAGANMFIAGSAIFNQPDYQAVITAMRAQIAGNARK